MQAALLLTARSPAVALGLAVPSAEEILAATGAGRSRAYELAGRLRKLLPTLLQGPGRPPAAADHPNPTGETLAAQGVTRDVLSFLMANPGCAQVGKKRDYYSAPFRAFIIELRHRHDETLSTEMFANACGIRSSTLKMWLAPNQQFTKEAPLEGARPDAQTTTTRTPVTATAARIATVVAEWERWSGNFSAFVAYLQRELRLPMGKQLISSILIAHGQRLPKRRQGRSPDEVALRGAFETFFPNAQWVGDGKTVVVKINEQPIALNLELNVDASSSAWVGLSVRDEEDSQAVIEAFRQGIETTGAAPMAELFDNKAANHTPQVEAELGSSGTLIIPATRGRAQNKAHVEGAFGLFAQEVPELRLDTNKGPKQTAKQLLRLVATVMARMINHRPRRDRSGRSRYQLHQRKPTPEEHQAAKDALEERARRQELRRQTAQRRQRPEVKAFLDEQFDTIGIPDPKRYHRLALGRYPLGVLCDAFAIFKAKLDTGTIPEGCDPPRYLRGIVVNLLAQREQEAMTHYLYELRSNARDHVLAALRREQQDIAERAGGLLDTVATYVRNALESDRVIDSHFWVCAATDMIRAADHQANALYRRAAAVVQTAFKATPKIRQSILLALADSLVPVS